jgi:hypothetical protein
MNRRELLSSVSRSRFHVDVLHFTHKIKRGLFLGIRKVNSFSNRTAVI